jgi:hypothetical protein
MGTVKLTPKQRKFAESYVECGNASMAYRLHYNVEHMNPASVRRAAKELLDNPNIAPTIRELQAAHRQRHDVTIDSLVDELEEARSFAMVVGHIGAAVAATMGKAKLYGLITDHHNVTGEIKSIREMSDEDLDDEINKFVRKWDRKQRKQA